MIGGVGKLGFDDIAGMRIDVRITKLKQAQLEHIAK